DRPLRGTLEEPGSERKGPSARFVADASFRKCCTVPSPPGACTLPDVFLPTPGSHRLAARPASPVFLFPRCFPRDKVNSNDSGSVSASYARCRVPLGSEEFPDGRGGLPFARSGIATLEGVPG